MVLCLFFASDKAIMMLCLGSPLSKSQDCENMEPQNGTYCENRVSNLENSQGKRSGDHLIIHKDYLFTCSLKTVFLLSVPGSGLLHPFLRM